MAGRWAEGAWGRPWHPRRQGPTIYEQGQPGYEDALVSLSRRGDEDLARVEQAVRAILDAVRERGDEAVLEYTERFDGRRPESLVLDRDAWLKEARTVDAAVRASLQTAADRIRRYHEHQRETGFRYEEGGIELGQRIRPVTAAAVYAPGGKARYPSTVLMTAIPARVAGVERVVLITPNPTSEILAAAEVAGELYPQSVMVIRQSVTCHPARPSVSASRAYASIWTTNVSTVWNR